jgi:NAD(P)-dependent dehydrogenase (short-subunit alcohol dehydrogenase family)
MSYFVTGATGFLGEFLMEALAKRKGTFYLLVRKDSEEHLADLKERLGADAKRIVTVKGDLTRKNLGVRPKQIEALRGKVKHFFHVAALYDLLHDNQEEQERINVEGTRHALDLAEALGVKCFHYTSSVAVAGSYRGVWREDMFAEAEHYEQAYFRTKHLAEGVVREACRVPYRIYRPAIIVGHSKTGEIKKVDGPYYFFKFLQKVRRTLPAWMPMVGVEGGRLNIVPVDYVARAMDYLAHKRGLDGRTFHLTDPEPHRVGEVINIFARAAHSPDFTVRIDARMLHMVPSGVRQMVGALPAVQRIVDTVLKDLSIPREMVAYINYPTKFDNSRTQEALAGSGIECPPLGSYAPAIWDYWERNFDPDLFRDRSLKGNVADKVVVITGSSSGIGRAAALRLADAGATVCLVARGKEGLQEVRKAITDRGGAAWPYEADLSDMDDCERVIKRVLKDHGRIDILVNNAGRSIRRSVQLSYDRFHDYQRTMQLNYFGAIKLILGVLPGMVERHGGHIINVSSIGVLANSPRFSAYVASKSALDGFSRCVRAELLDKNIHFTTINMPLVRTPMIAPTRFYQHVPALTVDEAADMIVTAIIDKPRRIATRLGIFAQVMNTLLPNVTDVILNTAYKLFPESSAATGDQKQSEVEPSTEAMVFASIMRGVYW